MKTKLIFQTLLIMIILSINAMATIAPKAPINAGAYKFTENSTRLSFMDMSDNEEGFRVYHNGDIIGTVGAKDGNGTYQYITLRDLKKATLYTVNIVAYNNAGESTPLIKSFRTISIPKSNVPAQPGAYIGVWNETEDSVRISFMDNSDNEDGFRVEDLDGNVLMDNIPSKDSNGTYQHVTLSGLDEGKLYFIRVFAYNESGVSTPSSTRAFRTKGNSIDSCDKSTAITREKLREMIKNGEDVTEVNTCMITDMSNLFDAFSYSETTSEQKNNIINFNQDISGWDVSHVVDMSNMFNGAEKFNQPIGDWDVSNVNSMFCMFQATYSFNQPIGDWDVSNVTNMFGMFDCAKDFNQDIGSWNVSNVGVMIYMFAGAKAFNQNIGNWDVSNVGSMDSMFYDANSFNQYIGGWDVSQVSNMYQMFKNTSYFDQDISGWDVSNVTVHDDFAKDSALVDSHSPFPSGKNCHMDIYSSLPNNLIMTVGESLFAIGRASARDGWNGDRIGGYGWSDGQEVDNYSSPGGFKSSTILYTAKEEGNTTLSFSASVSYLSDLGEEGSGHLSEDTYIQILAPSYTEYDNIQVVKDNIRNLMWQDNPTPVEKSFAEAENYCNTLEWEGYDNWRLPSFREITSYISEDENDEYWSSRDESNYTPSTAWTSKLIEQDKDTELFVKCIREI